MLIDVTEAEVTENAVLHKHALSYCMVLQTPRTEVGTGPKVVVVVEDGGGAIWRALFRLTPTSTPEEVVGIEKILVENDGGGAVMQDTVVVVNVTSANVLVTLSSVSTMWRIREKVCTYRGKMSSVVVKCLSQETTPRIGTRFGSLPQTALKQSL